MCQIIDCGMFETYRTVSIREDDNKLGQKNKILEILEQSNDHIKFQQLTKFKDKNINFYGILFQVINKLHILIAIQIQHNYITLKAQNIFISELLIVTNKANQLLMAKQLIKGSVNSVLDYSKTKFCPLSGEISIQANFYIYKNNTKEQQKKFNKLIEILVDKSLSLFYYIQKICSPTTQTNFGNQVITSTKLFPILRYLYRSTVEPSFSFKSQCAEYGSLIKTYTASNSDLECLAKVNAQSFPISQDYFSSLSIYGLSYKIDDKCSYTSDLIAIEKEKIQTEIAIPSFSLLRSNENKFAFNHCYFYAKNYSDKKIGQGGNSQIYVMKAQVYEQQSSSQDKEKEVEKNPKISYYISKHLIHKKQKGAHIENFQNICYHQGRVVSYIRGGSCLYLPKYYLNIQKATPYHNKLFIDYVPGDTLDTFMLFNVSTISTATKLWLMCQITKALRFINQFGIVHLDVKEANVIVMKKLICKLIDFGEAYHSKVCGKSHKPKYSLLYGSPEVVTNHLGRGFSEKSDVYSLGIMMYKIFFGKYPYFFRHQKAFQQANFENSLRKRTFYTPQDFDGRGDQTIMIILSQLILRCIQMDEKSRPFIDWVILILKNCLNYLVSD